MQKLTEQEVFSPFIGKAINHDVFGELAHDNSSEYVIYSSRYLGKPNYQELFGITDKLKEHWEYSGVDFNLYLSLEGEIITKCHIDKYREGGGGHGRPMINVLKETQQELRVARRIMHYITK